MQRAGMVVYEGKGDTVEFKCGLLAATALVKPLESSLTSAEMPTYYIYRASNRRCMWLASYLIPLPQDRDDLSSTRPGHAFVRLPAGEPFDNNAFSTTCRMPRRLPYFSDSGARFSLRTTSY